MCRSNARAGARRRGGQSRRQLGSEIGEWALPLERSAAQPNEHTTAEFRLLGAIDRQRRVGHGLERIGDGRSLLLIRPTGTEQGGQTAECFPAAVQGTRTHQRCHEPHRRIESAQCSPARSSARRVEELSARPMNSQTFQATKQGEPPPVGTCPGTPGFRGDRQSVQVGFPEQLARAHPAPALGRVHDLHQRPNLAPDQDEVGQAVRLAHDEDGGQGLGLGQKEMIGRHHGLFGDQAEAASHLLDDVDGSAVNIGLAGLAQSAVVRLDAETDQGGAEDCRAAVQGGGLNNLGDQPATPGAVEHERTSAASRQPFPRCAQQEQSR